jgi:hypothetical protein
MGMPRPSAAETIATPAETLELAIDTAAQAAHEVGQQLGLEQVGQQLGLDQVTLPAPSAEDEAKLDADVIAQFKRLQVTTPRTEETTRVPLRPQVQSYGT